MKNKEGENLSEKLKLINYQNACILAAHQYLVAQTGTGYLNAEGKPQISHVEDFIKLGADLMEYFYSN